MSRSIFNDMNEIYNISYDIAYQAGMASGASDSGSNPDRSVNHKIVEEKLQEHLYLLSLNQNTKKWHNQVTRWLRELVANANPYDVIETITYLRTMQEKLKISSYKKRHFQIKKFLANQLDLHYLDKVKIRNGVVPDVRIITKDDVRSAMDYFAKDKHAIRYHTVIRLLCSSGMRISELYKLDIGQVCLETRTIRLRADQTKTRKSRVVYFDSATRRLLEAYLIKYQGSKRLFNSTIINEAFRKCEFKPKYCRKYFSQVAESRGMSTFVKEYLLGHAMQTVDYVHYCALSESQIKEAYDSVFNGGRKN